MNPTTIATNIDGKNIIIETGKLAKQADGAVTVRLGDTIVIVTAVSNAEMREGQDFFPLTVDYREKAAAVGRFPGGYFRREGRPSEKEVLTCRMIDRPLRPLFPKGYFYDTQIIALVLSADGQNDPDILAINGASAALMVSDIPFAGPVAAVRVGRVDGNFVANPTHAEMSKSDLDLVYVCTEKEVIMIEGGANQLPDDILCQALDFGHEKALNLIHLQKELAAKINKTKRQPSLIRIKEDLVALAREVAGSRIESAVLTQGKQTRYFEIEKLHQEFRAKVLEKDPHANPFDIKQAFTKLEVETFRRLILESGKRCDGRGPDEIRPLSGEIGFLPRSHGSSLFARGETQAVCMATLAPADEAQELDAYTGGDEKKRFILHYNFPPFSVGETGRFGGAMNRREIGHGALAERSILPVIPPESEFGYAIRVSSEVMESNGSTSMASVCGGTLSLMDAGVPIKAPVAGISVGLITDIDDSGNLRKHTLITDILGSEDHYGDMDFKLSGTRTGFTGLQLDLKLPGISLTIMKDAIKQAAAARLRILDFMDSVIQSPRTEMSPYAPRIECVKINPEKIGALIGPGGKTIKGIVAETGVEINVDDDGTVRLYSNNPDGMSRAKEIIQGIVGEIEIGKLYRGKVVTIKDFGAFIEVFPGRDGLVHISELSDQRVNKVEDAVRMGEELWVKCIGVDDKGRVKLSRKAALKELSQKMDAPAS